MADYVLHTQAGHFKVTGHAPEIIIRRVQSYEAEMLASLHRIEGLLQANLAKPDYNKYNIILALLTLVLQMKATVVEATAEIIQLIKQLLSGQD